ncbi:VOC family protein [Rhizobium lusitanum]|uniref:PhnB protein n=1 Tax=Rhizobium lusitanum TaxID=293958 RepID=A0A7X0MDT7_9HYPH|nr:VOC family protein [Rhizobium lusitanum]MBB6486954.1 PhnB protein [Rhizobium lusitanum]
MAINTVTHINFRGNARKALSFYQGVFGGKIDIISHAQAYGTTNPDEVDLVGWGQVVSEDGFAVMAHDVPFGMAWNAGEIPYFVSVRGQDAVEISAYWVRLSQEATIIQPLEASAWAKLYGKLKDRFGVTWVLDVPAWPA